MGVRIYRQRSEIGYHLITVPLTPLALGGATLTPSLHLRQATVALALILAAVLALWILGGSAARGATLNVTTTDDGVAGSLRQAIADAASGDTIEIPAGVYTLTTGTELNIDKPFTLNGAGSGDTIIQAATSSADATSRVFQITGDAPNVAISGVTVRNGNTTGVGGGIFNAGTLTLTNSTVSGSFAGNDGGGITSSDGRLNLANSTISGNSAADKGGGVYNLHGTMTMTDNLVIGNSATVDGGGVYNSIDGTLNLAGSTVMGNSANGGAGGIYNSSSGTLTLTNSMISDNTAIGDGGGIYNYIDGTLNLASSTVSGNMASNLGGGIRNRGTITVSHSNIIDNSAPTGGGVGDGGGIINSGTLAISTSTVSGNLAGDDGGGIRNHSGGTLTLTDSTVSGNTALNGGGILATDGTLSLTTSTFSNHTATLNGGGIYNSSSSSATLTNTIIAGNTAFPGLDCAGGHGGGYTSPWATT